MNATGSWPKIHYAQEGGWSVPWTIRRVERRVSQQRRRGLDNRTNEREGSLNRRRGADRRAGAQAAPVARIRVLVVEDNRLMRDGLARLLSAYPDVDIVASVENATTAARQLRDSKPQVVLLDAGLAGGESYSFLTDLKTSTPDAKVIVIDFVPAQQDVNQFIDGGANGFIMKDATAEDIVKAIRSVASGTDLPPPPAVPRISSPDGTASVAGGGGAQSSGTVRLTKPNRLPAKR